jgi:hypothetical protein
MGTARFSIIRATALVCAAIILAVASGPQLTLAQDVRTREDAARILDRENVTLTEDVVSGDVANRSRNSVRDVQHFDPPHLAMGPRD